MKDLLKISITVLACVLMSFNTHSQRLYLDEIIALREMDTTQLKIFCESKGFKLKKVEADAWRAVITYQSVSDSSISFFKNNTNRENIIQRYKGKCRSRSDLLLFR